MAPQPALICMFCEKGFRVIGIAFHFFRLFRSSANNHDAPCRPQCSPLDETRQAKGVVSSACRCTRSAPAGSRYVVVSTHHGSRAGLFTTSHIRCYICVALPNHPGPQQFPKKLYDMIEIESNVPSPIVTWTETGRAFRIVDVSQFTAKTLTMYFKTSKFSSFQRNLNLVSRKSVLAIQ